MFALLQSKFNLIIAQIEEIKHKLRLIFEDFEDWMMNLERASPQKFKIWDELVTLFNFTSKSNPNKILDEFYLEEKLFPIERNVVIDHLMFPLKTRFHAFLKGLSDNFGTSLFQLVKPKM